MLRLRGRLDHVIDWLVHEGLESLEPALLDVLRLGAYQLLELDRVPDYAAVSESVERARQVGGPGAASLTNAVLRRLQRESLEACPFPDPQRDAAAHLSTWGSHPRWLIERWLQRWPAQDVERLVEYNNSRPPVYVTVLEDRDRALARLRSAGIEADPGPLTSVRVESGQIETALDLVAGIVQDPGAAAVVAYADLPPGCTVLDLCAAPGGKALALAGRGHQVVAVDVSSARVRLLEENRARLGMDRVRPVIADALAPPVAGASALLLDVPCTGTGTLARHPDARWRLAPTDLEALVGLQGQMLDAAASLVVPGGWLVYATCSLELEENEEQTEGFLARHGDFELMAPESELLPPEWLSDSGALAVRPQLHGHDGAYAARFWRRRD